MWEVAIRVPATGLTLEERRIVEEGYRLAELLLRDYRDPPPGPIAIIGSGLARCRQAVLGLYRVIAALARERA
jgi:hypothetical protein